MRYAHTRIAPASAELRERILHCAREEGLPGGAGAIKPRATRGTRYHASPGLIAALSRLFGLPPLAERCLLARCVRRTFSAWAASAPIAALEANRRGQTLIRGRTAGADGTRDKRDMLALKTWRRSSIA